MTPEQARELKAEVDAVTKQAQALVEPPPRMKSKTTKPFVPAAISDPLTLLDRFHEANTKLDSLIARATGLATTSVKVVSPFNARVKYNLYAALRIVLVHERRHLFQAGQVKAG